MRRKITKTLHLADSFVKFCPRRCRATVRPMRIVSIAAILVGVFAIGLSPLRARGQAGLGSRSSGVIGTYCAGCHNGVMRSPSGVLLDQFDTARISENPRHVDPGLSPASGGHDAAGRCTTP